MYATNPSAPHRELTDSHRTRRNLSRSNTTRPCRRTHGSVKTTRYFREQVLDKRPYIDPARCAQIVAAPLHREEQPDGPEADMEAAADESVTMVVQVNGRVRARIEVPVGISESAALDLALSHHNVARHVGESEVRRVIDRRPRLLNIVG